MVLELNTGLSTSEDVEPGGMDCEILHWLERETKHFL